MRSRERDALRGERQGYPRMQRAAWSEKSWAAERPGASPRGRPHVSSRADLHSGCTVTTRGNDRDGIGTGMGHPVVGAEEKMALPNVGSHPDLPAGTK